LTVESALLGLPGGDFVATLKGKSVTIA
jgi:hypothetical protein